MKALFYRTFTVNQSSTMPALILLLLVCLIPIPWMQNAFWSKLLGSVPLLLLVLQDHKDHWYVLAATLPLSPREVVGEKFLLAAAFAGIYPTAMLCGQLIFTNYPFSVGDFLCVIGFLLLFFGLFLFLVFWRSPQRATLFYVLLLFLLYLGDFSLFYSWTPDTGNVYFRDQLFPLILAAGAAVFLASFFLSCRLYTHQGKSTPRAPVSVSQPHSSIPTKRASRVRGKNAPLRALLYKDGFLIRKGMLPFLVVLTFVLLVFRIPMKNVDLCLLPLLGMVVPLQLMALDEQSKWTFAARLYPYTPQAAVLSRYIWGWMFTTLGVALSVGTAYWSYTTRQLAIPADTFSFLCWLVGATLIALAVEIPLLFRTGLVHGKATSLALLVFFWIVSMNLLGAINQDNPLAALPQVLPLLVDLAPLVPLIGLAVNLLSIPLAVREYRLSAAAA